jgi:hypothetical protein
MHGAGGGAPQGKGNGNFRTGSFTGELLEARRLVNALRKQARMADERGP